MPTTTVIDPAFPITYMALIIWVFFLLYRNDDVWVRVASRIFAFLWGIFIMLHSMAGESWLTINTAVSPPTFTLTQFDDGFGMVMGLTVMFISLIVIYRTYANLHSGTGT